MKNTEVILIGYSGHAYVLIDVLIANDYSIIGYCELEEKKINPFDIKYLGNENSSQVINLMKNKEVFIGIGDNLIREKTFTYLHSQDITLPFIQHPSAIISRSAIISDGAMVMPGVIVNALAAIGKGVICNTGSIIEHEVTIGHFSHIAPGATIAGSVKIGKNCFIGANAVIRQGITIGNSVVVGAGAVVVEDIEDNSTYFGNPAKKYK